MEDTSPITLISDLALILCSAGVTTLIFKKLKQPVVLGYIIAGFLVGPHFEFFPTIAGSETTELAQGDIDANIRIWSDIGVIFLLFTLGLEFSFKKLMKVGAASSITSFVQIISMSFLGYFAGQLIGWPVMDSIFLGAILCISSTTIIIRNFDELNLKDKKFARVVFGALIVEDLVAVLLMVMLSTVAVSRDIQEGELLMTVLKLIFFLILWFASGIFFLPSFLKYTKKLMNDETLLVVAIGLCFAMVLTAERVGFSQALGAFITGSILAETTSAERIAHLVKPVKDLFGAVFFVSVGMMIVPSAMVEHALPILIITLLVIFGKPTASFIGALISGQPLKQSVQTGLSLSLIGEFSFIIAQLGLTLNVTSDFLYPITIAVSAITTFTAPYIIRATDPVYKTIERVLPEKWMVQLNQYSTGAQHINAESDWKKLIKSYLQIVIINATVSIGLIILFSQIITPFIFPDNSLEIWQASLMTVVSLIFMAPFLWALTVKKIGKTAYTSLWLNRYNRGPILVLELSRVLMSIFLVGFLFDRFFSTFTAFLLAIAIIVVALLFFSHKIQSYSARIERRFMSNYNAREQKESSSKIDRLTPWDAHIAYFDVSPHSFVVGKTLLELTLREQYGINIAMIQRGGKKIYVPGRNEKLYPQDHIAVIATDGQLNVFREKLEEYTDAQDPDKEIVEDIDLIAITVDTGFPFLGKSVSESKIREATQGLIVGIERNGERILNPDSNTKFLLKDTIWIVANRKLVKEICTNPSKMK